MPEENRQESEVLDAQADAQADARRRKLEYARCGTTPGLYRKLNGKPGEIKHYSVNGEMSKSPRAEIEPGSAFDLPEFTKGSNHGNAFQVLREQSLILQEMLEAVEKKLPSDAVEFGKVVARLRDLESRLSARERRNGHVNLESIDRRLTKVEGRIEGLDQRLRRVTEVLRSLAADVGSKRTKLAAALARNGAVVTMDVDAVPLGARATRAKAGKKARRFAR